MIVADFIMHAFIARQPEGKLTLSGKNSLSVFINMLAALKIVYSSEFNP